MGQRSGVDASRARRSCRHRHRRGDAPSDTRRRWMRLRLGGCGAARAHGESRVARSPAPTSVAVTPEIPVFHVEQGGPGRRRTNARSPRVPRARAAARSPPTPEAPSRGAGATPRSTRAARRRGAARRELSEPSQAPQAHCDGEFSRRADRQMIRARRARRAPPSLRRRRRRGGGARRLERSPSHGRPPAPSPEPGAQIRGGESPGAPCSTWNTDDHSAARPHARAAAWSPPTLEAPSRGAGSTARSRRAALRRGTAGGGLSEPAQARQRHCAGEFPTPAAWPGCARDPKAVNRRACGAEGPRGAEREGSSGVPSTNGHPPAWRPASGSAEGNPREIPVFHVEHGRPGRPPDVPRGTGTRRTGGGNVPRGTGLSDRSGRFRPSSEGEITCRSRRRSGGYPPECGWSR
jgi:hypothetical protein